MMLWHKDVQPLPRLLAIRYTPYHARGQKVKEKHLHVCDVVSISCTSITKCIRAATHKAILLTFKRIRPVQTQASTNKYTNKAVEI